MSEAWKRDADGWAVRRGAWMPVWVRIPIRIIVLLPIVPLIWLGWLGQWLFDLIDPYLPAGL